MTGLLLAGCDNTATEETPEAPAEVMTDPAGADDANVDEEEEAGGNDEVLGDDGEN